MDLTIFLLVFFFIFPPVSILMSDKYEGRNKLHAFVIVLFTSWIGRIWLWVQER